jgi:hypothetical protein
MGKEKKTKKIGIETNEEERLKENRRKIVKYVQ